MKYNTAKSACVALIVMSLTAASAYSQDQQMKKVAQSGMKFLDIGVGARAAALGGAYAAMGEDVNAIFWNPAGLARISSGEVSFSHTQWIADISHVAAAGAWNFGSLGTFGASFITMDYGDIYSTTVDASGNEFGYRGGRRFGGEKINVGEYAAGVSYSRSFTDRFSIGAQVKYVHQSLGSNTIVTGGNAATVENKVSGAAVDFGVLYNVGIEDMRLGLSIQNFSQELTYEREAFTMPLTFRVGMAMDVLSIWNAQSQKLTLAVEGIHGSDYSERVHVGGEYWFGNVLALRSGYMLNYDEQDLTFGAGINYGIGGGAIKIDYAYTSFGVFDSLHRFTLGISL